MQPPSHLRSLACLTFFASLVRALQWDVVGCYVSPSTGIFDISFSFQDQPDVTYEKCAAQCPSTSTIYSISDGYTCSCGTTLPANLQTAPSSDCRYLCSGDSTQWCGGDARGDVFRKPAGSVQTTVTGGSTRTTSTRTTQTTQTTQTSQIPPTTLQTTTRVPGSALNTNPPGGASQPTVGVTTVLPGQPGAITSSRPTTTQPVNGGTTGPPALQTNPPNGRTTVYTGPVTVAPGGATTVVSTRAPTTTTRRGGGNDGNNNNNNGGGRTGT